jgi:hypothetical protein
MMTNRPDELTVAERAALAALAWRDAVRRDDALVASADSRLLRALDEIYGPIRRSGER